MRNINLIKRRLLWIMSFLLFMVQLVQGENKTNGKKRYLQDQMIWINENIGEGTQQYVVFRKNFQLKTQLADPSIEIFADSRYLLWINGHYVSRGPVRFNPKSPEYDIIPIKRF